MAYSNWMLSEATNVTDLVPVLNELFFLTDDEIKRHERTEGFVLVPGKYSSFVTDSENYKSYSVEIMNLIKKSDNVLYQTKLEYSDKASRDTEVLSKEKRDIMYALNVLNYLVLPVQQEIYMADKETAMYDKRLVKGTAIDMFAAVTHFNERYVLPHVHILYMAPQPELSVFYRGFIRQLERDPLMLPVRKEQLNEDIIQ